MSEHPLVAAYRAFSPASEKLSQRARTVFPGGDTRSSAHYAPYPLGIAEAGGCRMRDFDGHEILDFMNNFTSLIHGHAHPDVVAAVQRQVAQGSAYAAPNDDQIEFAELMAERVPSIEQLRFTSSGSEATLMAIRAARAFTGRQKLVKVEGGYHGSYDHAEVSMIPRPGEAGPIEAPRPVPLEASIADSALADVIPIPYNQPEIARARIEAHADEIAAVIVEPILGSLGMLPAERDFLQALRSASESAGALLILDEVISFRLGFGGAQERLGIRPDLTALGKIIGGGLPIGAVGGRRDVMESFDPARRQGVWHASTFSGNPLSMAAGLAALEDLTPEAIERIDGLGARLREGFDQAFRGAGVHGQATGSGSLVQLHLTDRVLRNARDTLAGLGEAGRAAQWLQLSLLRHGVFLSPRGMCCVSTAHDEAAIDTAVAALEAVLTELRPVFEHERPALLD